MKSSAIRSRWAAFGAAVAVSLGAGGIGITHATISSGERAVFVPLDDPCRLASTRPAPNTVGPRTTGIGPEESYTLDGWGTEGDCTLPSGTAALALNVTAVNASQQTNLRFFPADAAVPATANLNPSPGASPTPNAVNVNLDGTGQFKVFNKFGVVEVVIDVMGYYEDHNHDDRYYTEAEVDALSVAASASTNGAIPVASDTVVQTVSLVAPADGAVIVNSQLHTLPDAGEVLRCSMTTGTTVDFDQLQISAVDDYQTVSGTRSFDVASGATLTVNLVCNAVSDSTNVVDRVLTAIFVAS